MRITEGVDVERIHHVSLGAPAAQRSKGEERESESESERTSERESVCACVREKERTGPHGRNLLQGYHHNVSSKEPEGSADTSGSTKTT